jgi:hypothetical protein
MDPGHRGGPGTRRSGGPDAVRRDVVLRHRSRSGPSGTKAAGPAHSQPLGGWRTAATGCETSRGTRTVRPCAPGADPRYSQRCATLRSHSCASRRLHQHGQGHPLGRLDPRPGARADGPVAPARTRELSVTLDRVIDAPAPQISALASRQNVDSARADRPTAEPGQPTPWILLPTVVAHATLSITLSSWLDHGVFYCRVGNKDDRKQDGESKGQSLP